MSVAVCAYDHYTSTDTLATYFAIDARHQRMADYLVGSASAFNLENQLPMAIAAIEQGADYSPYYNWMQLSVGSAAQSFVNWYNASNQTGQAALTTTNVEYCDAINAAAGTYWLSQEGDCSRTDWTGAISQASSYNGTCGCGCPIDTAYGWTAMFLAYGNGYAIPAYTYVDGYYPTGPTGTQTKYVTVNSSGACGGPSTIDPPVFTPTYETRSATYGANASGKQIAILTGSTVDYVSGLQVALDMFSQVNTNINTGVWASPMVLMGTYYAARMTQNQSSNMVIVLGPSAKTGIDNACSALGLTCVAYSSYSAWASGSQPGYVDCSGGTDQQNYSSAHNNAFTAAQTGSY